MLGEEVTITIITPAFNCIKTIEDTFKSVLNQTISNWEWIIVDDCSTDGSFKFVQNLIKNDKRIKLIRNAKNSGTAVARNVGLKNASGRYITFLDSDDCLDFQYLEKQLVFIKEHGPIVSAGYRRKTENSCTDFFVPKDVDYKTDLKGNPLSCLTTMYDKEAIGDVFFREDIIKPEDYVFWLDMLKRGFVAHGNPEVLATDRKSVV